MRSHRRRLAELTALSTQRYYKNLWPSLRAVWLSSVAQFSDRQYIIYEDEPILTCASTWLLPVSY